MQGEGGPSCRNALKNIVKIDTSTPNGHNGALLEVGAKTGDLPKILKNGCQVLDVVLDGSHKNLRIIRIERSTQNGAPPAELM